jgi:hypothetical protein
VFLPVDVFNYMIPSGSYFYPHNPAIAFIFFSYDKFLDEQPVD